MLFRLFSNIIIYIKIVGKIPDQHLSVWLFSNPGDKVHKRGRTMVQICPVLSTRIWTLSSGLENKHTFKWHIWLCWKIVRTTFQCQCPLSNPGDKILFFLKFHEARISEWNISSLGMLKLPSWSFRSYIRKEISWWARMIFLLSLKLACVSGLGRNELTC